MIELIPENSSQLEYRRNEEIFVSSTIEYSCNKSFSIFPKWTIWNSSSKIEFAEATFSEFYIPSYSLSIGLYELKLTVTVGISSNLTSSKSVFIKIISSGIVLNLVEYGPSIISHGYKQDLELNPGKYSIDLDGYQLNPNVSYRINRNLLFINNFFIGMEIRIFLSNL